MLKIVTISYFRYEMQSSFMHFLLTIFDSKDNLTVIYIVFSDSLYLRFYPF